MDELLFGQFYIFFRDLYWESCGTGPLPHQTRNVEFRNQRLRSFYTSSMCWDLQKASNHKWEQKEWHHRTRCQHLCRCTSFQQSFLELRSRESHKLFWEARHLCKCYLGQSRQFWCLYRSQSVDSLAWDLYEQYWVERDTQSRQSAARRTYKLPSPWPFDASQCSQIAHRHLRIPWWGKASFVSR